MSSIHRPIRSRGVAALLPLVTFLACAGPTDETSSSTAELPTVDRVVLITIDTLRADHLSSFGYPIETSPWLDGIARRGVVFRRAYAHSATTKPSHSSLFTSLYPIEHGVLKNGHVLADNFLTMAEMMQAAGYRTAGFVSTDVPLDGNVGQGFEHWDLPQWNDPTAPRSLYRPAQETVDRALAWLDAETSPDEKVFLWVHLYDPHNPLQPPDEDLAVIDESSLTVGREEHIALLAERDIPADQPASYDKILRYDGEIHYADSELARLKQHLESSGFNRDALWIVTSDHGQGLGAHGWFGHSVQIYNAQLHVPLVFWFTNGAVAPRQVSDHLVRHVDVLPTLSEIVGGSLSEQIVPIRGRSLTPFLRGEEIARSRASAFAQRSEYAAPNKARLEKGNYEPGSRYALQTLTRKYLLFTEGSDELYDLEADPYERVNLISDPRYKADGENLAAQIRAIVESSVNDRPVDSVSEEAAERLRSLGYIQ